MVQVMYGAGVILALMALAIITGVANAASKKCLASGAMRQGVYKKFGSIVICSLAVSIFVGGQYIGIAAEICGGVVGIVFASIGGMELLSVVENACALNPDLPMAKLLAAFGLENDQK